MIPKTTSGSEFTPGRPLRAYDEKGRHFDFSTDDLVGKKLNYFQGWKCAAGNASLFVGMDGEVYGASCKVGGLLGNVFEDFQIPNQWLVCPAAACSCGADHFIPKAKSDEHLKFLFISQESHRIPKLEPRSEISSHEMAAMERTHFTDFKQVHWEIGRRCNYACSYCSPNLHNKTDRHKTFLELITATEKVIQKFSNGSPINFIISGGEPTLNPDFLDWIRYIRATGNTVSMHSNGTRLPDYYRELIHYGDLNLSAHFETIQIDKFVQVVAAITDEKIKHKTSRLGHLEVKMMMAPGRRPAALELQDALLRIPEYNQYCTWAFVPIRTGPNGDQIMEGYTSEDFALFGNGRI